MKNLHLDPDEKNILETFCNDSVDRSSNVVRFCNILDAVEDCLTIALDGQWGSGKTFFIKQVKLLLDYNNTNSNLDPESRVALDSFFNGNKTLTNVLTMKKPQATLYYNAWENDTDIDPILSIIYSAITDGQSTINVAYRDNALKIAGRITSLLTGRDFNSLLDAIEKKSLLDAIKNDKVIETLMKEFITDLIIEHGDRLVVFIDELDRCKPTFAVKVLEQIKHFFNDDRITFVFSVNIDQLQHTVKNYYGSDFNACRYLDKFFDIRAELPKANYDKYLKSIDFQKSTFRYDIMCETVIRYFGLELRETAKFVRVSKLAVADLPYKIANIEYEEDRAFSFALTYVLPILIALKICSQSNYLSLIQGKDSLIFVDILKDPSIRLSNSKYIKQDSETYDKEESIQKNIKWIVFEDRLTEIYSALFCEPYNGECRDIQIGGMLFSLNTRKELLSIASLLSPYSNSCK